MLGMVGRVSPVIAWFAQVLYERVLGVGLRGTGKLQESPGSWVVPLTKPSSSW